MRKSLIAIGVLALALSACGKDKSDLSKATTPSTTTTVVPLTTPAGNPVDSTMSVDLAADNRQPVAIENPPGYKITDGGKRVWVAFRGGSTKCNPAHLELKRQDDNTVVANVYVSKVKATNSDGSPISCELASYVFAMTGDISPPVNAEAKVIDGSKL